MHARCQMLVFMHARVYGLSWVRVAIAKVGVSSMIRV
jgi:hypothetical protein